MVNTSRMRKKRPTKVGPERRYYRHPWLSQSISTPRNVIQTVYPKLVWSVEVKLASGRLQDTLQLLTLEHPSVPWRTL